MLLDVSLRYHLKYNHYPPLPDAAVTVAKRAIVHAHECEGFSPYTYESCDHTLDINGTEVRVTDIIETFHLDFYLDDMREDDE